MYRIFLCIISVLFFSCDSTVAAKEKWLSSFPPLKMELDQAITSAFAAKFNAAVKGEKVPFARRLVQLKTGEIDILAGILRNDEREEYAYFIHPPYKQRTNKIFIILNP